MSANPNKDKKFDKLYLNVIEKNIISFLNDKISSLNINGFTASIILKHIKTYKELVYMYIYDDRPLSIGYSGGKDSTVTMDIVLKSLLLCKHIYNNNKPLVKKTFVMFSDTLLEMDPVIEGILNSISELKKFSEKYELNLDIKRVSPTTKNTLFSLLIGKGYMVPRTDNRYCTDRMKILPQKKAIISILRESGKGFIAITGQRQDEGVDRKKRMKQLTIDGSFKQHEYKDCNLYAPLEYWSSNDVWSHIYSHKLDWIDANTLGRVYSEASNDGDECRSLFEGNETGLTPGCGKSARYGCWVCTLFNKDKTLNNLSLHYDYLKYMEEFRNWLVQFRQAPWDNNRDVFIHGKHKMKLYDRDNHRKGMKIPGGYNLHFRKQILIQLLETERKVIEQRKTPLITDEELAYIQECWIEDGDLEMTVKQIAYDRNFEHLINQKYPKAIKAVELMKNYENLPEFYVKNFSWKWIYDASGSLAFNTKKFCERYFSQMALQLESKGYDSCLFMGTLTLKYSQKEFLEIKQTIINLIRTLPLETKMDFIDNSMENYIRKEWKEDKIGFITFCQMYDRKEIEKPKIKNLFGYESEYAEHFEALEELEIKKDIIDCEKISLQDKMRFFDEWNS